MAKGNPTTTSNGLTLEAIITDRGTFPVERAAAVMLDLVRAVGRLHADGHVHRAISAEAITFDEADAPKLAGAGPVVMFGGLDADLDACPPALHDLPSTALPADIDTARQVLIEAGVLLDPRQIDFYQLGAVLCAMVSHQSVGCYLHSPKGKAAAPKPMRPIIDRALGLNAQNHFASANEFAEALEAVRSGKPPVGTGDSNVLPQSVFAQAIGAPAPSPTGTDDESAGVAQPDEADAALYAARSQLDGPIPFEQLGHYRIIERIGCGAMGDVYRGHEEALDREVAIKVLPPQFSRQEGFLQRFRAEATNIAKLAHPNILQVYYTGEDQGHHFFAMQYVDGQSLSQLMSHRTWLTLDEALPIIEQCLAGLGAAHEQGLIHRDIKPDNILLDRQSRRAMIADFGLVKAAQSATQMTATGMVMGTADYIAPEQARGLGVDQRSDLYSIGVILYQMFSGRLPFNADSPTAMMFQHSYEPPPPLHDLVPDEMAPVADVVMKLLAKDPDQRHPTADAVLEDLHNAHLAATGRSVEASASTGAAAAYQAPAKLSAELAELAPTKWWGRLRNWLADWSGRNVPQFVDRLQSTQQQTNGAVAEYERRRDQLAQVQAEARQLAEDLDEQAASYSQAAQAAAERAESVSDPTARQGALAEQQQAAQAGAEIAQLAAEQHEQVEELDFRLGQINATLVQLRAQRNALAARLHAAEAQLPHRRTAATRTRRLALAAAAFAIVLVACLLVTFIVFRSPAPIALPPGCVLYMSMDASTMVVQDGQRYIRGLSERQQQARIHGATLVEGKRGQALAFDGVDDYGVVEGKGLLGQYTIAMWVKVSETPTTVDPMIGGQTPSPIIADGLASKLNIYGRPSLHIRHAGEFMVTGGYDRRTYKEINSAPGHVDGQWHFVAMTGDSQARRLALYVDGALVGDESQFAAPLGLQETDQRNRLEIGARVLKNQYFRGAIDELMIFERVLSSHEIQSLHTTGAISTAALLAGDFATVRYDGELTVDTLRPNVRAFSNRSYTFGDLPDQLVGMNFIRQVGGQAREPYTIEVTQPGRLLALTTGSSGARTSMTDRGWTDTGLEFHYTDPGHTSLVVWSKHFAAGAHSIQNVPLSFVGVEIVAPQIEGPRPKGLDTLLTAFGASHTALVSYRGDMAIDTFDNSVQAFANSKTAFTEVPASLRRLRFIRRATPPQVQLLVTVHRGGLLLAAVGADTGEDPAASVTGSSMKAAGWKPTGLGLYCTWSKTRRFNVWAKNVAPGLELIPEVPGSEAGAVVLSPTLKLPAWFDGAVLDFVRNEELTEKLNEMDYWHIGAGKWTQAADGRIHGHGESRLAFEPKMPADYILSFRMNVREGIRPRVFFGGELMHFGNEGFTYTLSAYGPRLGAIAGKPWAYEQDQDLWIQCRFVGKRCRFYVNGQLVSEGARQERKPESVSLSAGDGFSGGTVEYWDFALYTPSAAMRAANLPDHLQSMGAAERAATARFGDEYLLLVNLPRPWPDASSWCQDRGATLACITSAAKNKFVCDYIGAAYPNVPYFLAGASDAASEGRWTWQDGSPFGYTNWAANQPSNSGRREHYLQVHRSGAWNDHHANFPMSFVAQWKINQALPKPAAIGGWDVGRANMIGRTTVSGKDIGLVFAYRMGKFIPAAPVHENVFKYGGQMRGVRIEMHGQLHVPEDMTVLAWICGGSSSGGVNWLYVDGREVGSTGDDRKKNKLYRLPLKKGDYEVKWVLAGGNFGSHNLLDFRHPDTLESLDVRPTEAILNTALADTVHEVIDHCVENTALKMATGP